MEEGRLLLVAAIVIYICVIRRANIIYNGININ